MNSDEFNEKYKDYLEKEHYGLAIEVPSVVEYLDQQFQDFILVKDFSYSQIKLKFGKARFYAEGLPHSISYAVEDKIDELVSKNDSLSNKSNGDSN